MLALALHAFCSTSQSQPVPDVDVLGAKEGGADPDSLTAATTVDADAGLLLPDVVTELPDELYISDGAAGREVRFSTAASNVGRGPLEIVGAFAPGGDAPVATQLIQREKGGEPLGHDVGELLLDPTHGHWHIERFAVFELWRYSEGGGLEEMLASTPKISFCLLDFETVEPPVPNMAPHPQFVECNWRFQGISEGWSETYVASLPGQALPLNGIADGRYAIRMSLDPDNLIRERSDVNNSVLFYVEIRGDTVELLQGP
jgi:hypothetical protein